MKRHRIPVRVGTSPVSTRPVYPEEPETAKRAPREAQPGGESHPRSKQRIEAEKPSHSAPGTGASLIDAPKEDERVAWRDRALRLQAEMDNYRKRQRRIAQEEAQASQERLLRDVLSVADNLDRTLAASAAQKPGGPGGSNGLRQGVKLTRDDLMRVLSKYGVERYHALGEPFDPEWHEAVQVVSAQALGVEPGTVVEVVQPGYRRRDDVHGERLFRPAQVVVAN